ncbi:MAG: hypothetical protein L0I76_22385 [Pseudonocardia sp.]|nr:hypothetical protein [Pseudonocardia sp.]
MRPTSTRSAGLPARAATRLQLLATVLVPSALGWPVLCSGATLLASTVRRARGGACGTHGET